MIADMISNKKLHAIVTGLFNKDKKLNITAVFNVRLYYQYQRMQY